MISYAVPWDYLIFFTIFFRNGGDTMYIKNTLYVGVDVSLKSLTTCILDTLGSIIFKPANFSNDPSGVDSLFAKILELAQKHDVEDIFIGAEATSVYDCHLLYAIADNPKLNHYNLSSYCFTPKLINNFKKSICDLPKNDKSDSFVIAQKLKSGKQLALQRLTRFRKHTMDSITREKGYLTSLLFLKFSTMAQQNLLCDEFGATGETLLTEFCSVDEICNKPIEELIDIIAKASKNRFEEVYTVATKIQEAAKSSFKLPCDMNDSITFVMKNSFEIIASLEKSIKHTDKSIATLLEKNFKNESTILQSIDGIGPVISAGIIAEIGSIKRFDDDSSLAKFAGLVWSQYQSGEFEAEDTHLKKSGNQYLRYYFCLAASTAKMHNKRFSEYYSRKYSEASSHKHKRALVLTARKVVKLVFALLRDNTLYTSAMKGGLPIED